MRLIAAGLLVMSLSSGLGACARYDYTGSVGVRPITGNLTNTGATLAALPPAPSAPLNVAVYDFQDLTGQNKSSFKVGFPEFSRAITQGASAILVDALKTAGNGCWFNVVERGYLDSLLRERKLIQDTYSFLKKDPKSLIDPLKFAEYIVTGGVVSYDSPTQTAAANVLFAGYGGGFAHNKDLVTVNLRLVRVRDGLVITSINASRPILNTAGNASVTRVIGRNILDAQVSAGFQEAVQTAVRESIEAGVLELVRQGDERGIWLRKIVPPPTPEPDKKPVARAPSAKASDVAEHAGSPTAPGPAKRERASDAPTVTPPRKPPADTVRKDAALPEPSNSKSVSSKVPSDERRTPVATGSVKPVEAEVAGPTYVATESAKLAAGDVRSLQLRGTSEGAGEARKPTFTGQEISQIAMLP